MLLAGHALDGRILLVPDFGDIQQDIRSPFALLRLMRFKAVDRWRTDDFFTGLITFRLGDDARLLGQVHGQRMVVVVRVFDRVTEHEIRLHATKHIGQTKQRFFVSAHRIVADVEEFHARAKDLRCGFRLVATCGFDLVFRHLAFAPELGRFTPFAIGEAHDMNGVTLLCM
ncbi:hypothetical protein D3C84_653210 [compost metagenome]